MKLSAALRATTLLIAMAALMSTSCTERAPDQPALETHLPAPTSPANVLLALEQLYEDNSLSPSQRASEYANLLVPPDRPEIADFRFMYGYCDIECPWEQWGFIEETSVHGNMFSHDRRILLHLNAEPDFDATYIMPDRPGWRVIHTDSVRISVWAGDTEVSAFTASEQFFFFAPANGRWYLAEWWERLSESMWASFKIKFASEGEHRS